MTKQEAAIIEVKQQSEFVCSACDASRDCNCAAPALRRLTELEEKAAERREKERAKKQRQRERFKEIKDRVPGTDDGATDDAETSANARKAAYAEEGTNEPYVPDDLAAFIDALDEGASSLASLIPKPDDEALAVAFRARSETNYEDLCRLRDALTRLARFLLSQMMTPTRQLDIPDEAAGIDETTRPDEAAGSNEGETNASAGALP